MSKFGHHGGLYSLEAFDTFGLDDFVLRGDNAEVAVGLTLARAAVDETLLEHTPDGVPAGLGAGSDGLLIISEQGEENSGAGLDVARAALEGTPAPPDLIAEVPLFALEYALTGSGAPEAPAARPSFKTNSGDITVLEPQLSGAKGGVPGPPSDGGGDGDDGGVLTNYYSGSADLDAGYDIWIEFKGSDWTVDLQQAFKDAADYLTAVITDDIGGGGRYRGKTIDDVYISAEVKTIDGAGGVLGQAGPTALWTATELTAAGIMEFDVADVPKYTDLGLWDDIVTHEMMHVLGFGSLWNYGSHAALVDGYSYVGTEALAAYNRDDRFGPDAEFIPVENDGGSGTAGAHWDETALNNELMTGYINNDGDATTNGDNYLSEFSVMALADLGYVVDYQDYPYDGASADALIT